MNYLILDDFRNRLKEGHTVYGPFMKTGDPAFAEVAGYAGFDFVILDMEHGPVSYENLQNLIRAAEIAGTIPVVRVSDSRDISISRALDAGALAVQIPQVATAEEARSVLSAAKFHPEGQRGVCRYVRAASYSDMDQSEYFSRANDTLTILQLEGKEAMANLDEILNVTGLDILFIGPFDLSQSLGKPGQVDHPAVTGEMKKIVDKAREKGIVVGTFTTSVESARIWVRAGIQYISISTDVGIFMEACKKMMSELNNP